MLKPIDELWVLMAHGVIDPAPAPSENDRRLADRVIKYVAREADITVNRLKSKSRKREAVMARQCVYMTLKKNTALTLEGIGELVGGRDHATVLHGLKTSFQLNRHFKEIQEQSEII